MKKLSILFLLLYFFSSCKNKDEVLTEKEVFDVINKFDVGWRTKNASIVDSVLSEQYLYFTQSGHTFNRVNLLATAGSQVYQLQTMEREQLTIQLEGNAAVVNTIWKGKGLYHGEDFNDKQRCSITIVKHKGQVKILAEHCTPIK
ncbi:MAG: hypothetical protein CK547_05765 [Chitinophagaceae bacterium]|nr:MAG: hypothetical protein CK547_05765 [Chitinophagaceae bacterium]